MTHVLSRFNNLFRRPRRRRHSHDASRDDESSSALPHIQAYISHSRYIFHVLWHGKARRRVAAHGVDACLERNSDSNKVGLSLDICISWNFFTYLNFNFFYRAPCAWSEKAPYSIVTFARDVSCRFLILFFGSYVASPCQRCQKYYGRKELERMWTVDWKKNFFFFARKSSSLTTVGSLVKAKIAWEIKNNFGLYNCSDSGYGN